MKTDIKRKMYMGIWRFMLPLPLAISAKGVKRGVSGAKTKADLLSKEELRLPSCMGDYEMSNCFLLLIQNALTAEDR